MRPNRTMIDGIPHRRCSRCKEWKPATTEYFYAEKRRGPHALRSACKSCHSEQVQETRDMDAKREYDAQWSAENRESRRKSFREWRQRNLEEQRERERQTRAKNREHYRQKSQEYRDANREKVRASLREYARNNRTKRNLHLRRYVARKAALPDNFTEDDWQFALDYFNGCCAVCERPPGLFHTLAMDHWIPLSSDDCPGTVPTNIVPLCHGTDGCNNSKNDKDPVDWLSDKFGKKQAKAIASKIRCFFDATSH